MSGSRLKYPSNILVLLTAILAFLGCQTGTVTTTPEPPGDLHVYLLIGQSNMAGRASYTEAEGQIIPHCFLLNEVNAWEPAQNPFNRYSTIRKDISMQQMNPGYSFVKNMLALDSDLNLGLVVNARGGSSIKEWERGSHYYSEAVRRSKIAQRTGVLAGVLWHQGEADYTDSLYLDKLEILIANLRQDLDEPDLPFVAGQIYGVPLINDQLDKLPRRVPHTGVASSAGLKLVADDPWHFDAPGIIELGKRYAEAILEIQSTEP